MSAGDMILMTGNAKDSILKNLSPRRLEPRENENLRDAELRWQRENDPLIEAAAKAGATLREIAERVQISTVAAGNSLRRSGLEPPRLQRTFQGWPDPIDYCALLRNMERDHSETQDYLNRLSAAIVALRDCLPFLIPEPREEPGQDTDTCQSPVIPAKSANAK
jgi:hypothetical protein